MEVQTKYFRFHNETQHLQDMRRRQLQYYSENNSFTFFIGIPLGGVFQIFPHRDMDMWGSVWMSHFRRAWKSFNFDKAYLFGFYNFGVLIYA